ncbi:MAG: ACT domain-containing protein [Negativicutes bacterium]|jgi:ACT domain-containing protein
MRIIITVVGKDRMGIIAMASGILAQHQINIINLDQNIVEGYFNMILIADMTGSQTALKDIQQIFAGEGAAMGLDIKVQHAGIFEAMHRI